MLLKILCWTMLAAGTIGFIPAVVADDGASKLIRTEPPQPVSERAFFDAAGGQTSIARFRGKVVLLNFWATWCAPCLAELPSLDRAQDLLREEGLAVVAVSEDRGDKIVAARELLIRRGFDNLDFHHDDKTALARDLGVPGLPTSLIIDRDGREVARLAGAAEWDSPRMLDRLRGFLAR